MSTESILEDFGLTQAEVRVYLSLLQRREATASEISKITGNNRTFTYDRLKKLADAGLVSSVTKDTKKYFRAAEPSQFLAMLKEREERLASIMPELEKLSSAILPEPKVEFYSTSAGVKTVLNLMLRERSEICLHGSLMLFQESMPVYFAIWNQRRIAAGIKIRVLSSEMVDAGTLGQLVAYDLLPEEEKGKLSQFTFGSFSVTVMWGEHPVAILVESREIAKSSISSFNAIWNREVKIYSGKEGIQLAFMALLEKTREMIGFGYSKRLSDIYTLKFSDRWHDERVKRNISARLIALDDSETREYFRPRTEKKRDFTVRHLAADVQGPACISLSDMMMATFVYTESRHKVIINKNKETIRAYKRHFEYLWSKSAS